MRETLEKLRTEDNLRILPEIRVEGKYIHHGGKRYLNLSSNDYLGIAAGTDQRAFLEEAAMSREFLLSNPSSRLITGNSPEYTSLERCLSEFYGGRSALVLGSGYLANSGVLPALTCKNDLILADKLVHASLIDGMQLSGATVHRFAHNDTGHLEKLLKKHRAAHAGAWIVTESLFSMDGDRAPLAALAALKRQYDCKLYLDEAHAFGACGPGGRGLAAEAGMLDECDILVATLGKAVASQGAFVLSDALTRDFLTNRMRTLIFSTALPPLSLRWSEAVIRRLDSPEMEAKRRHLQALSALLTGAADSSHIVPLMAGENSRAIALSEQMREAGFWAMPIRTPTVPPGSARVRISLSAALATEDISALKELWKSIG